MSVQTLHSNCKFCIKELTKEPLETPLDTPAFKLHLLHSHLCSINKALAQQELPQCMNACVYIISNMSLQIQQTADSIQLKLKKKREALALDRTYPLELETSHNHLKTSLIRTEVVDLIEDIDEKMAFLLKLTHTEPPPNVLIIKAIKFLLTLISFLLVLTSVIFDLIKISNKIKGINK